MSKKSPQLRFEGFTDDWEERKFKDNIVSIQTGTNLLGSAVNEGTPLIKMGNLQRGYFSFKKLEYLDSNSNVGSEDIVNYGDFLFNTRNTLELVGKGATWTGISGKYAFNSNIARIKFDGIDTIFFNYLYNTQQVISQVHARAVGTTSVSAVYPRDLNSLLYYLPSIEEQQKIGSFFKQLDNTIALHQRKLDLLKEQKKGYLQKMFPKNGAKVPELRFAGFADDWEQRKLNEVSDIYDGTHQTPKYQDNGVMFLSVENIKTLTSNKFISREAFEDEFKIRPQRGDVLMTRIGDIGTANVVETDEDLAYYVSLALFKSEELNPYFLQASIYAPFVQDQIWKRTLHIAFPKKINKNEIGQVPINVPTLAEQTKIGSFFKQLDDTIALHQRKLDLLKEQKKGFLQKMFV